MKQIILILAVVLSIAGISPAMAQLTVQTNGCDGCAIWDFGTIEVGKTGNGGNYFNTFVNGRTTETITYTIVPEFENDTVFSCIMDTVSYAPSNISFNSFSFKPLAPKTYNATFTIFANGDTLKSIPLKGIGVSALLNAGQTVVGNSSLIGINLLGLNGPISASQITFTGETAGHAAAFSVESSEWDDFAGNDSITIRFTPTEPLIYQAVMHIDNGTDDLSDINLKGTGYDAVKASDETVQYWYYLKYASNDLVIQSNGDGQQLTTMDQLPDEDTQLWKYVSTTDYANFYNKADPTLRINFQKFSGATTGYYATSALPDINVEDLVRYDYPDNQGTSNYKAITRQGSFSRSDYYAAPDNQMPLAPITTNSRVKDVTKAYLRFIYWGQTGENGNGDGIAATTADRLQVYPNPTTDRLTLTSTKDLRSLSVINAIGQTQVLQPASTVDVSRLAPGIYFLKAEKASGVEIIKFIKR